jgi:hypothetical protein
MIVSELIERLKIVPSNAEVVTGKDKDSAWVVVNGIIITKYKNIDVCIIREGV